MIDRADWNASWFDRNAWIFDHIEQFSLSSREILVLLVINYLNDSHQTVTPDAICAKTGLDADQVDQAIESLDGRGYLKVEMKNRRLCFLLDGLIEGAAQAAGSLQPGLIGEFAAEFGRPLSPSEMERISALSETYTPASIAHALDECAIYDKHSVSYVETILAAWKRKGLSDQDLAEGKR